MNDSKIMSARKELVAKTIRREKTDKPAFMFIADGYYPFYANVEKSSVTNYAIATDVTTKVTNDLQYDTTLFPFWPPNLNVAPMNKILGGGCFTVKDFVKMQVPDAVRIMEQSEYPKLIEDPAGYLLETAYPRRFKLLANKDPEARYSGLLELLQESQKVDQYYLDCANRDTHILFNSLVVNPVDFIFDFMREFEGIINDIKRCPDLVRDAGLAIAEQFKPLLMTITPAPDRAIFIPMHIPAFLRPKDFEKTYWPSFKLLAEFMVGLGHNVIYYFEKRYGHLFDYLQDLPQKGIIGIFQEDDIRETKKRLGNTMAIAGGLSTTIMQNGTKEDCIAHVRGLIEDVSSQGGYFISPDTPMMFSVDARPENLKAVADTINSYRF